jgi:short-subunit dehydrogenase
MAYALITGGGKGIGKAIAMELSSRGYNILLVSRTQEDLVQVSNKIEAMYPVKAQYFTGDLSVEGVESKILQWIQSLDVEIEILVNNAGYGLSGYFDTQNLDTVKNMMQLNMITLTAITYVFLPQLKNQEKSFILNIASTAAYQAIPELSVYAATKSFVLSFSRSLRVELKNSSVSVTCVLPGPTNTAFMQRANLSEKGLELVKKIHTQPEKVAKTAVHALLSGKTEVIPGLKNKLTRFFSWLLPKSLVERISGKLIQNVLQS